MKILQVIRLLALLALPLSLSSQGSASSLHGKVSEVLDGERLTVISVTHPLKIKLMGVATPVKGQPYADVAGLHLSQLVSGKFIGAHCTALEPDGYLRCRVMLDGMDVGEQMVRDGVAWFNPTEADALSEEERRSYMACEQAARGEARGLWKDKAPIAPWDFTREQELKRRFAANPLNGWRRPGDPSLSSDDLLRTRLFASSPARNRGGLSDPGWKTLAPKDARFSVLVPGDAYDAGTTGPTGNGKIGEFGYCGGQRGKNSYLVIWGKGPSAQPTESEVADDVAKGLMADLENRRNKFASDLKFEVKRERSLKLGPFAGWQYRITGAGTGGLIRVFAKRTGQELELYVLGVMNGTENESQVQEFLGSLTIAKY